MIGFGENPHQYCRVFAAGVDRGQHFAEFGNRSMPAQRIRRAAPAGKIEPGGKVAIVARMQCKGVPALGEYRRRREWLRRAQQAACVRRRDRSVARRKGTVSVHTRFSSALEISVEVRVPI